ncbi:TPR repeat-containing protein [Aliiroseovarius halocynthiae]|uniref:Tetratricopeptide repeat protein n=1 Tax=Aliiroseovarius halocynthiae TaxID=985055 RepID=A0A545SZR7_9RHOB|nr:tetratricopeptide repeat protein [Aliiroseovarius halocynthiae]TQV70450.1 tetratricopeptide repeat protein [Aliiroseovarius halocynthiae]SMR81830.1 TPR repeat-containing protein [Aliiroseovarius halocynthiae]
MPLFRLTPSTLRRLALPALLAAQCAVGTATYADNAAGAYLAVRHADLTRNFPEVVEYGVRAIAEDPENLDVLEGLIVAQIALGKLDDALPYARRLASASEDNQIAALVLLGDALATDDWDTASGLVGTRVSIAPVIDQMIQAWIRIGQGKMSDALAIFDGLGEDSASLGFTLYQKALTLAYVGDFEGAARILGGEQGTLNLNRSGLFAHAQSLSQSDQQDKAIELMTSAQTGMTDPEVAQIIADLEAGKTLEFDIIRSPQDGIAELLFAVAESLGSEGDQTGILLYNRLAEHLAPTHAGVLILTAQILEGMRHHDLAIETYGKVPQDSFAYQHAALGRTDVLRRAERFDEATGELRTLADAFPDTLRFRVALGDTLMLQDRYDEARDAYDLAIGQFEVDLSAQWPTYFQRAIAAHKLDDWTAAEADFRKALELSPEQPTVLNYLGYSLVERREKMDEALDMIERAVAARPDRGYIVDSLGWVLYRLGRYDEAVVQMERAVELEPVEPILNDHLGDTYWAVGRKREAEFQWSRALSFITDDTDLTELDPDRIRRKLEVGLDVVLEEEGAAPLNATE